MAIVASGQITITDLNDARQLVMYIGASQSRTVIYDGLSTYIPNYETSNQILKPQLFVAGDNTDRADEAIATRWYYQSNGMGTPMPITVNTDDFILGTNNSTLTIKSNILSTRNSMTIICETDFADSETSLVITSKAEIEIVKVTNGVDGLAIYANVWTPNGNSVKNGNGTIQATVDLYNGLETVVGDSYKWYIQDPTATTTSGGDADGGNGWRLLDEVTNYGITGYITSTITIPANAIAGTESFKCVVSYNGSKYGGVTTIVDLSDPIVVRLDGMDKFKNGEGSVTVTATLLRVGEEIDIDGTTYNYSWSIYDSTNVKTPFSKTGKTITVNATDINGRGNLICDVSTK